MIREACSRASTGQLNQERRARTHDRQHGRGGEDDPAEVAAQPDVQDEQVQEGLAQGEQPQVLPPRRQPVLQLGEESEQYPGQARERSDAQGDEDPADRGHRTTAARGDAEAREGERPEEPHGVVVEVDRAPGAGPEQQSSSLVAQAAGCAEGGRRDGEAERGVHPDLAGEVQVQAAGHDQGHGEALRGASERARERADDEQLHGAGEEGRDAQGEVGGAEPESREADEQERQGRVVVLDEPLQQEPQGRALGVVVRVELVEHPALARGEGHAQADPKHDPRQQNGVAEDPRALLARSLLTALHAPAIGPGRALPGFQGSFSMRARPSLRPRGRP